MSVDLFQYVMGKLEGLADDLRKAIKEDNPRVAGLIIRLLTILEPELKMLKLEPEEKKPVRPKRKPRIKAEKARENKGGKATRRDILSSGQLTLFSFLFGLAGKPQLIFSEALRELYPELKGVATLSKTEPYARERGRLIRGFNKIRRVLEGEIDVNSLPESNQQFYQQLAEKFPEETFSELKVIVFGESKETTRGKKDFFG